VRRMSDELEEALENCITLLEKREESMKSCLDRYPDLRESLEPLLRTALAIEEVLPEVSPSATFKKSLGVKLDIVVKNKRKELILSKKASRKGFSLPAFLYPRKNILAPALAAVLVFAILSTGTVVASANTLPNSVFYPVKRAVENVKVILSIGAQDKAQTYLELSEKRLNEAMTMANINNEKLVENSILSMDANLKKATEAANDLTGSERQEFFEKLSKFIAHQHLALEEIHGAVSGPAREAVVCSLELNQKVYEQTNLALYPTSSSTRNDILKKENAGFVEGKEVATVSAGEELSEGTQLSDDKIQAKGVTFFKTDLSLFSPNGDRIKDICKINVNAAPEQDLWVDIFSEEGESVRSNLKPVENLLSKGSYKTSWNGKNNAGKVVLDGIYLLKLKGEDGNYVSLTTKVGVDNTAPASPDLLNPKENEEISGYSWVTLSWSSVPDAEKYILQYSGNSDFKGANTIDDLGIFYSISVFEFSEGKWHWRVKSVDNVGNASDYSFPRTFTIQRETVHNQTTSS